MTIAISGTTGITLANQFDSASTFGFKNRIINGQMQIAQRATSATITAGSTIALGYSTVDRFYVYCTGANVTAAQVAGTGATKNRLQITGAASVTAVGIGQRIEQLNSYDMAGLLTTVTWTAYYANTADTFGTLASPTRTQIATGTFTVTSTLTNYSTQISIPAAATTGIEVVFTVGAQTSGTWVIGNVQLEKSSIATSFDYRPYGTELALCQRYLPCYNATSASNQPLCSAYAGSSTVIRAVYPLKVNPRVPPTGVTVSSASHFSFGGAGTAPSAIAFESSSIDACSVQVATTGATANTGSYLYSISASAQIQFTGCEL